MSHHGKDIDRLCALLAFHHPLFECFAGDPGLPLRPGVPRVVFTPGGEESLHVSVEAPVANLARSHSGLGFRESAVPASLWPLQVTIAVAHRHAIVGLTPELEWPMGVLASGERVGALRCGGDGEHLSLSLDLALGPLGRHLGAPTISLGHAVVSVLDSPWSAGMMLPYYRRWCRTIGTRCVPPGWSGDIPVTVRDVDLLGRLVVEDASGKVHEVAAFA